MSTRHVLTSLSPGLVFSTLATLSLAMLFPEDYDWSGTRSIALHTGVTMMPATRPGISDISADETQSPYDSAKQLGEQPSDKELPADLAFVEPAVEDNDVQRGDDLPVEAIDIEEMERVFRRASWYSAAFVGIITIASR